MTTVVRAANRTGAPGERGTMERAMTGPMIRWAVLAFCATAWVGVAYLVL